MSVGQYRTFNINACLPDEYHLKWRSGNERIADVNENTGLVHAKAPGRIFITAYCPEDASLIAPIELTVSFSSAAIPGITSGNVYLIKNTKTQKYLYSPNTLETWVTTKSGHMDENENVKDGKMLWYVVKTSVGYQLCSMGLRDEATHGLREMVLKGKNAGSPLPCDNEFCLYGKWSISYSGGEYYLTNTSYEYNNMSVSVNPNNNNVVCKKLNHETEYAKWQFEKIEKATFNNYWPGDYVGQGASDVKYFKIILDTTGDDSVYRNNIFSAEDFECITDYWNNISENIVIYGPGDNIPSNITAYTTITIHGNPILYLTSDHLGEMVPVSSTGNELKAYNDWYGINVFIYTGISYNERPNPLEDQTASDRSCFRREVLLHEIGHAFKLAHPDTSEWLLGVPNGRGAYPNNYSVASVMDVICTEPEPFITIDCTTPKYHDKINLTNKWD